MSGELDKVMRAHLDRSVDRLCVELEGLYTRERIEQCVYDSLEELPQANFDDFVPVLAHRFARRRLRAEAQADGRLAKDASEVLFVDVKNAGRSQLAAALLDARAEGRVHVRSAGVDPATELDTEVVASMSELDVDMSSRFPKPLTDEVVRAADVVVTMGARDACPVFSGRRYLDWEIDDPVGADPATVRRIRDDLDQRVTELLAETLAERERRPADLAAG
jgi:protein-tyrosine-phosphatase